jgi:heat shock protein HtpX
MNNLKTLVLLTALSGILIALGGALGGSQGVVMALILAAVMNIGSYWFSADILLRMAHAREIQREDDPHLFEMVAEVAERAGMPMPRVYVIDDAQPNAFATGRDPQHAAVAVTGGIRALLNDRELMGVMGHEMAHVKNRDILTSSVVATIASAISSLPYMAMWFGGGSRDGERGNPLAAIVAMLVAPLAASLIQMAISRSREFQADLDGARTVQDPEALASALAKLQMGAQRIPMQVAESTAHLYIVNPFSARQMAGLFSTHPPTEERIARLRSMRIN